ncbi:MAG: hypothetical protein ABSH34_18880 [Verrucomicrobiota bacterium]|jgi:hypothetical protein
MNPELEALLKAWDAFLEAPEGAGANRLQLLYEASLEEAANHSRTTKEALHRAVMRYHPRWVRANLPPGFPKQLGLD